MLIATLDPRLPRKMAKNMLKLFRRARGLTLIGAWAFAPPISIQSGESGRIEISIGATAGQYEVVSRGCSGEFVSSRPVPVRTGGVVAEYEFSTSPFRVAGLTGVTSVSGEFVDQDGWYAGALVAYEGGRFGLGAGPVLLPPDEEFPSRSLWETRAVLGSRVMPSLYLRIGDRAGAFFQSDFLLPSPFLGATGLFRTGVGFRGDRTSGFFGFASLRALDLEPGAGDNGGPFGEFRFPLGQSLDALIAASWFPGEEHRDWGAGIGLRYRLGR